MTADLLSDLLKLFSDEDLIRFTRRAEIRGMLAAAELLCSESKTREDQSKMMDANPSNQHVTMSFSLPSWMEDEINERVRSLNITRSEYLRVLVRMDLDNP